MNAPDTPLSRRRFLQTLSAGGLAASGLTLPSAAESPLPLEPAARPAYEGLNVVVVRFGGGVRRRETIVPETTYAPWMLRHFAPRGTLFSRMEIDQFADINTSHGEGTLYILTGKYDKFHDVDGQFLGSRFESKVPTLFEYLRHTWEVPEHQTLIINGEDRTQEEFYSFSNHHLFGAEYRSNTLSLYRYKTWLLRQRLTSGSLTGKETAEATAQLAKMEAIDYRTKGENRQAPEIEAFWQDWRADYGDSGLRNPRGDRLLTELALRSLRRLQPRLMMINYNDPDYVHWGNMNHYTEGVKVIDDGLRQLVEFVDHDPFYRERTLFVVVPDCGRDTNPFSAIPCQHHFNSRSSHEIWALLVGPGVPAGTVVDKPCQQISLAATVGQFMKTPTPHTEGPVLAEAFG